MRYINRHYLSIYLSLAWGCTLGRPSLWGRPQCCATGSMCSGSMCHPKGERKKETAAVNVNDEVYLVSEIIDAGDNAASPSWVSCVTVMCLCSHREDEHQHRSKTTGQRISQRHQQTTDEQRYTTEECVQFIATCCRRWNVDILFHLNFMEHRSAYVEHRLVVWWSGVQERWLSVLRSRIVPHEKNWYHIEPVVLECSSPAASWPSHLHQHLQTMLEN